MGMRRILIVTESDSNASSIDSGRDNCDGFIKGGSLGLFIGFSFFALWDIFIDNAIIRIITPKWLLSWCLIVFYASSKVSIEKHTDGNKNLWIAMWFIDVNVHGTLVDNYGGFLIGG